MVSLTVISAPPSEHPVHDFALSVAEACSPGARVLEVGAGTHHSGRLKPVLARRPHLVAIDPDPRVLDDPVADERVVADVQTYAAQRPEPYDVAFAVYVLEHVADPQGFLDACAGLLRPGGSFFALTLNVHHYFGGTTWALSRLHVEERVLHRLHREGAHAHDHCRTEYRLNSVRALRRTAGHAGFADGEIRCFEAPRNYGWYLPRGTGWVAPLWTRAVYAAGLPSLMGHLSVRLVR
jgi:2-polyprenyl-3-methyl-5-hydroxy-6-metoxy-1,4-benzoquinol methylase